MSDFPRKAQFPLLMACAIFPAAVMIAAFVAPDLARGMGVFAGLYLLVALPCLRLPGRVRLAVGALGSVLLLGLGIAMIPMREAFTVMLVPIGYAALLLHGLPMAAWPREREPAAGWIVAGVIAHVLGQAMVNGARAHGAMQGMLQAAPLLLASFLIFLLLAVLSMNRSSMQTASLGRRQVPPRMRRRNVMLTLGFLALVLLVASIPEMIRALRTLWHWLGAAVSMLIAALLALLPDTSEPMGEAVGGSMDMSGLMEAAPEPSAFLMLLERIAMGVALIVAVVLAFLALRFLYRRLKALIRHLRERLGQFAASATEDYVDEITDTRDDSEEERLHVLERLQRRFDWGHDGQLPPRERIRRRYMRLRRRHHEWYDSQTARETIPGEAARLYERARYSDHEVTEAEAKAFTEGVKRV